MTADGGAPGGRRRRRGRWWTAAAVAVALAAAAYLAAGRSGATDGEAAPAASVAPVRDDSSWAPEGARVRVEVLNATAVRGLARRATMELRDRGFDVVEIGNAGSRRDSTLVLYRAGEQDWAYRVARAMGGAPVELRPDSTRYLEVTVLLGSDWRPPPGPFRP